MSCYGSRDSSIDYDTLLDFIFKGPIRKHLLKDKNILKNHYDTRKYYMEILTPKKVHFHKIKSNLICPLFLLRIKRKETSITEAIIVTIKKREKNIEG